MSPTSAARNADSTPSAPSGFSSHCWNSFSTMRRNRGVYVDGKKFAFGVTNPSRYSRSQCFFFQLFHHLTAGPSHKRLIANHKRRERDGHLVHRHDAGHGKPPRPMQRQSLEHGLDVLVRGLVPKGEVGQLSRFVHQYFFRHFVHARILRRIAGVEYSDFPRDQFIHAVIVRRSACNRIQAILYEVACP